MGCTEYGQVSSGMTVCCNWYNGVLLQVRTCLPLDGRVLLGAGMDWFVWGKRWTSLGEGGWKCGGQYMKNLYCFTSEQALESLSWSCKLS